VIHIRSARGSLSIPRQAIRRAARAALVQQASQGDLSIVLADDARLQELNREYLGIDAPTDVLSFPAAETDPQSGRPYLGDILISVPRAAQQAGSAGYPVEMEVQLLVIHGVLHLLGHDHAEPTEKSRMWTAQSAILESIGLGNIQVPEEP
jgi:probable rRNA maturation factor